MKRMTVVFWLCAAVAMAQIGAQKSEIWKGDPLHVSAGKVFDFPDLKAAMMLAAPGAVLNDAKRNQLCDMYTSVSRVCHYTTGVMPIKRELETLAATALIAVGAQLRNGEKPDQAVAAWRARCVGKGASVPVLNRVCSFVQTEHIVAFASYLGYPQGIDSALAVDIKRAFFDARGAVGDGGETITLKDIEKLVKDIDKRVKKLEK